MNEQQFGALLDRFGGDLSSWPEEEAKAAKHLLSQSSTARQTLSSQTLIEQQVAKALTPPPTFGLEQQIIGRLQALVRKRRFSDWFGISWKPTLAATCSLAFGLYLGAMDQTYPIELEDDVAAVMFFDYIETSNEVNNGS